MRTEQHDLGKSIDKIVTGVTGHCELRNEQCQDSNTNWCVLTGISNTGGPNFNTFAKKDSQTSTLSDNVAGRYLREWLVVCRWRLHLVLCLNSCWVTRCTEELCSTEHAGVVLVAPEPDDDATHAKDVPTGEAYRVLGRACILDVVNWAVVFGIQSFQGYTSHTGIDELEEAGRVVEECHSDA